jgi:hypothetical protein
MSHPSIFALKQFVDTGVALDPGASAHVSHCPSCAAALQRLASRALALRGLEATLPSVETPPRVAALAFAAAAAAMAVMLTSQPLLHRTGEPLEALAPEGVHGVWADRASPSARVGTVLVDGGAQSGRD